MSGSSTIQFEYDESSKIFDRFDRQREAQPVYVWTGAFSALSLAYANELITNPVYVPHMRALDQMEVYFADFSTAENSDMGFKPYGSLPWHFKRWSDTSKVKLSDLIPGEGAGKEALLNDIIDNLCELTNPLWRGILTHIRFWTFSGNTKLHPHPYPFGSINIAGPATLDAEGKEFPRNCTSLVPPNLMHKSPKLPEGGLRLNLIVYHPYI